MGSKRSSWSLFGPRFKRDGSDPAVTVVANADIFTSDRDNTRARAVRHGRIIYVGDDDGAAVHVGPDTKVIDTKGRFLTPSRSGDRMRSYLWSGVLRSGGRYAKGRSAGVAARQPGDGKPA